MKSNLQNRRALYISPESIGFIVYTLSAQKQNSI